MISLPKRPPRRPLLEVANQYLHGELSAYNAAGQLTNKGPLGKLLAGEVLLDEAARGERHMASSLLQFAKENLGGVVSQTEQGTWKDGYDHAGSLAKARMRLAQFKALTTVYSKRMMPQRATVQGMYSKLLSRAVTTADTVRLNPHDRLASAIEVRGVLGEMAVLLLAQRYALREADSDVWLPLQSLFSEDSGGDCVMDTDAYAWDLNVLTPGGNGPETTYTLQIKSIDQGETPKGPTLYIASDLALQPGAIITACDLEAQSPDQATHLTQELDARTEKLLNFFD